MKNSTKNSHALKVLFPSVLAAASAVAQDAPRDDESMQEVVVTGSRIIQSSANSQQPVSIIDRAAIERTSLASIGELLQQVTASGKALNAKFNSSGNFGYPADGGGIGAGSAQVDLRNLGSKRVLVLVDGIRWVNQSSASGVSGAADLNTIPISIIDRVEVLEDGASAIYGSDAIAGVINIITRKTFEGVELNAYRGEYEMGGPTNEASITLGGSGERFQGLFVASYYDQEEIGSGEWEQSSFPQPLAGLAAGSSGFHKVDTCSATRHARRTARAHATPPPTSTTSHSILAPRLPCGTPPIPPRARITTSPARIASTTRHSTCCSHPRSARRCSRA